MGCENSTRGLRGFLAVMAVDSLPVERCQESFTAKTRRAQSFHMLFLCVLCVLAVPLLTELASNTQEGDYRKLIVCRIVSLRFVAAGIVLRESSHTLDGYSARLYCFRRNWKKASYELV